MNGISKLCVHRVGLIRIQWPYVLWFQASDRPFLIVVFTCAILRFLPDILII